MPQKWKNDRISDDITNLGVTNVRANDDSIQSLVKFNVVVTKREKVVVNSMGLMSYLKEVHAIFQGDGMKTYIIIG